MFGIYILVVVNNNNDCLFFVGFIVVLEEFFISMFNIVDIFCGGFIGSIDIVVVDGGILFYLYSIDNGVSFGI